MTKTQTFIKFNSIFALALLVLSFESTFAINPSRTYQAKPNDLGIRFETLKIKVNDSIVLNSWACLQKDLRKPFVIISNSDAGNMSNSLGQAQALFLQGYNLILYDYRGFGESSDFGIDKNMMYYDEFSEDLSKVIAFADTKFKPTSIVLYGMSMGTIVSRMNLTTSSAIKGLILDSFVIDPTLVVDRIFELKQKKVTLPITSSEYIRSNKKPLNKPVLIFSGLKDPVTKTIDYAAFLAANKKAKMITSDCGHLESFISMGIDPNVYVDEIIKFIQQL